MLTALNNQVGLSADQQDKAKPIIEKHVADLEAVKNDVGLNRSAVFHGSTCKANSSSKMRNVSCGELSLFGI